MIDAIFSVLKFDSQNFNPIKKEAIVMTSGLTVQ